MKENKISVVIDKPIQEVFEFSTNPINTHLWVASIVEEVSDQFPAQLGTQYKNHGEGTERDTYEVVEYEPNKIFTLADSQRNFHVRYTYMPMSDSVTQLEYFERMEEGELSNPFTLGGLETLKRVMEK